MRRFLALAIIFLSPVAFAASYTLEQTSAWNNGTGALAPTPPTRAAGNLLLVFSAARTTTETISDPTGWTRLTELGDPNGALWGRIATNDANDVWSGDWSGTSRSVSQMTVWSGDVYTDLGTIVHNAAAKAAGGQTGMNIEALTVTEDDTLVLIIGRKSKTATSDGITVNAEAGFTEISETAEDGTRVLAVWNYVQQTTAANITAGGWDFTGTDESATTQNITVSLLSSGVTPPAFDSGPTLDACDDTSCTFDYDADATADEIHFMATDTAASTPNAAQIEAETGSHGAGGEASTGAADTFTVTFTDSPVFPIYDVHAALEEGTSNYSTVATVSDVFPTAPTGFQFIAITSVGVGSPCEAFNTAVNPDIANGDYLLAPTTTTPDTLALTIGADCQFEYFGNGSLNYAVDIAVYDASVGDWHASDIDFFDQNDAPVCSVAPSFIILDEDEAMSSFEVNDFCDDDNESEGDDLSFAVTAGTLPNGLSLNAGTGAITGTPDTEDETGEVVTVTVTDLAQTTDTLDITFFIINTYTAPDCTADTVAACITAWNTAAPWYDGVSISTSGACSETVAADDIISQSPTEATEVDDPLQAISVVVSVGLCANGRPGAKLKGLSIGL